MRKLLSVLALLFCLPLAAQQINPATNITWPRVTGAGTPTALSIACTSANYGQPFQNTAVTPNTNYSCTTTGWQLVNGTGGGSAAWSGLTPGNNTTASAGYVFSGAGTVFQCTSGALCNANEINAVPLCTGVTPTTGQALTYTTGSSPNPCLTYSTSGGAVSSVSNSDGTLTITPTTGAVVASLNLGHANTWTAAQAFSVGATMPSTAALVFNANSGLSYGGTAATLKVGNGTPGDSSGTLDASTLNGGNVNGTSVTATSFLTDSALTPGNCVQAGSAGLLTTTGSACGGGGGSGTVSGQANGVIPLATAATSLTAQSHLDDGNTTAGTITSSEPIAVNATSLPSQMALTYDSHALAPGSSTTAVYGVNSTGQAVISETGGAAARVCDATNGVCGSGGLSGQTINFLPLATSATASTTSSVINQVSGNIGINVASPAFPFDLNGHSHFGDNVTTNPNPSQDPYMTINRTYAGQTGTYFAHAYTDDSTWNCTGCSASSAIASYDSRTSWLGAIGTEHYVGFQSIPFVGSTFTGTINRLIGTVFSGFINCSTCTVNSLQALEVDDYTTTSSFHAGVNYGIHVLPLSNATTNWGIHVDSNDAYFGGHIVAGTSGAQINSVTTGGRPAGSYVSPNLYVIDRPTTATGAYIEWDLATVPQWVFGQNPSSTDFVLGSSLTAIDCPISTQICDFPTGATGTTLATDTHTGAAGGIKLAPWVTGGTYNCLSMNGNCAATTMVGWVGGATVDPGLYGYVPTGGLYGFNVNGSLAGKLDAVGWNLPNGTVYGWGASGTNDTGLSRDSAGVVDCGNGTAGNISCNFNLGGLRVAGGSSVYGNVTNLGQSGGAFSLVSSGATTGAGGLGTILLRGADSVGGTFDSYLTLNPSNAIFTHAPEAPNFASGSSSAVLAALPAAATGLAGDETATAGVPAGGVDYIRFKLGTGPVTSINGTAESPLCTQATGCSIGSVFTAAATPGTGVTSVTCATATCTNLRGSYTVVGGTATTGTIFSLAWTATPSAYVCTATMNGGVGFLGIGNSVATTTGMNVTAGVTVLGVTFNVNYSCQP